MALAVHGLIPQKHPLARTASFKLADLQGEDFVFCTRESRPEFYDEFFRRCANAGFRPRVVKEVGGYPTNMLGLVSVGVGLSVLPHCEGIEGIRGIVWRPLTEPRLWADWALVWRKQAGSAVTEQFAAAAEAEFGRPDQVERAEF
jgi:DNA-binding transcriptional LysR family regulator